MSSPVNPMSIRVTVGAPPRGGSAEADPLVFSAAECCLTWSWGLQPATALIDWVTAEAKGLLGVTPDVALKIEAGGHTFHGICPEVVPVRSDRGHSVMQQFVDNRHFLQGDVVYAVFNIRDSRIVNGRFVRRYRHILPWDFNVRRWSFTAAPYSAGQLFSFLFGAPTVQKGWTRTFEGLAYNALAAAVYDLNWESGIKLGEAILNISEKLGMTFTLLGGPLSLYWVVKGIGDLQTYLHPDGTVDVFPPNSTNRRGPGEVLSGFATRTRILGDRNLYQVLNIDMVQDWLPAWGDFWDFNAFVRDIYQHERTEAPFGDIPANKKYTDIDGTKNSNAGALLARARAQSITVGQYAALRDARSNDGYLFRDYRRFQNRARLDMPVALYLSQVLFRAYRFPDGFRFRKAPQRWMPPGLFTSAGVPRDQVLQTPASERWLDLSCVDVLEEALVQVTHDPVTGEMVWDPIVPSQSNGYAIAQGFQVAQDAFKTLKPEYFNINNWKSAQAVWQAVSFHVDDSGEGNQFIVFDQPMVLSDDLITQAQEQTAGGGKRAGKYPVLNARATVKSPPVRVALTFAGERLTYWAGTAWTGQVGVRDDQLVVSGLNGQFVLPRTSQPPNELAFADGLTANQKAARIAVPLLNRQYKYAHGGYTVNGSNATQLSALIDRVTLRVGQDGMTEEVDFTGQRSRNVSIGPNGQLTVNVEPDRDFDRRAMLNPLLPGQAELREEVNQLRSEAAFLLKNPQVSKTLSDTFNLIFGLDVPPEGKWIARGTPSELSSMKIPAGTPLWREASTNNIVPPSATGATELHAPIFEGVSVMDGEAGDGPVRATRRGNDGVIYARVKGPVGLNDKVGVSVNASSKMDSSSWLQKFSTGPVVGLALAAIADKSVTMIPVLTGGGGGGGGSDDVRFIFSRWPTSAELGRSDAPMEWFWGIQMDGGGSGNEEKVALPWELRSARKKVTVEGAEITYSNYDTGTQTRLATFADQGDGITSEIQVIIPRYQLRTVLIVRKGTGTPAINDDNDVGAGPLPRVEHYGGIAWYDTNWGGRAWAKKYVV